ncbi:calcium-binding protein [Nostoc sp.]|uniref:calcium-binding protein n=1 Tax=Nostoc sp. TaxID=1180 RepID=UPI002FFB07B2
MALINVGDLGSIDSINKAAAILKATGSDTILKGTSGGNNTVNGTSGNDVLIGGSGNDRFIAGNGNDVITAGNGNNYIDGGNGNDVLNAGSGKDTLIGGNGNDVLSGGSGNDILTGGNGNDTLVGSAGTDILTGGAGNDVFKFISVSDSRPAGRDLITDFVGKGNSLGDRIDVSTIDANTTKAGNQAFTFIGAAAFSAPGQIRYSGGILQANTDGNLSADFEARLVGAPQVVKNDIIL